MRPQLPPFVPPPTLDRPPGPVIVAEERIHALDSLRATAMFLGIALHAACSFMTVIPIPWAARDISSHWTFDAAFPFVHGFRMQLFFFLAGFFARWLYLRHRIGGFIRHRWKRIGVPFLISLVTIVPATAIVFVWGLGENATVELPASGGWLFLPVIHLWFLQYLLILNACTVLFLYLFGKVGARFFTAVDRLFDQISQSLLVLLALALVTLPLLWNGPVWGDVDIRGAALIPAPADVGYFGLFYLAGWWLHRRRERMDRLSLHLPLRFGLSLLSMATFVIIMASAPHPSQPDFTILKATALFCSAFYAWAMTFAMTGLFLRFAARPQPWVRYLADSSYWCYLAHLPIILFLQIVLEQWSFPGWLKFGIIIAITMLLLLVLYEYRVRYTKVGAFLNGPRERPFNKIGLVR